MHYRDFIADPARDCAIVAHRGAWRGAPENSLAAIERAIEIGADIVELDVRKSADGQLFLCHDDMLLRMAGIDQPAESLTMAELQAIRLRSDNGGAENGLTDQRIPTLQQALDVLRGRIFADLDLKDRGLFAEVAACARDMQAAAWVDLKTKIMNKDQLDWVRAQNIDGVAFMAMAELNRSNLAETMALLAGIRPFICEIFCDDMALIAQNRQMFQDAHMALWVNTLDMACCGEWRDDRAMLDPDAVWGRLIDAGISVLQTDQPEALKAYIGRRAGR